MPRKVAVVVDTFPRWSERFVARELQELRRRGEDFAIVAIKRGKLPPGEDPEWDGLAERLRVLPSLASTETLTRTLAELPGLHRKETRRRLALLERELGPGGVLRGARGHVLAEWLREGAFTHVHAHFANWPSTIAWIAAYDAGLPLTLSVHARDLFVTPQLLEAKVRDADTVFVCSKAARTHLERVSGGTTKTVLMEHGLPLDLFPYRDPKERAAQAGRKIHLLAAGRFVAKKGYLELLDALQHKALARRSLALTILGDGPDRAKLDREIGARGIAAKVQIRPPESGPHLRALLAESAAFVAPYRQTKDGDRDGIPNLVLEAFATGVPVVGTDAGGLPEVLDSKTGFVAPQSDSAALAQAVAACLDHPAEATRRAQAARRLVEKRHDIRKAIRPLLKAWA